MQYGNVHRLGPVQILYSVWMLPHAILSVTMTEAGRFSSQYIQPELMHVLFSRSALRLVPWSLGGAVGKELDDPDL